MNTDQTVLLMGDIKCQYSEIVPIESLNLNPDNPNQHSEAQLEQYAKILQTGVRKAVRVSKRSNLVTVGHGHIQASLKNGWTHVPIEYQDYASEAEEYADMVADNALARQAILNFGAINAKIPDFGPELNIELLGIADFTIDAFDKQNGDSLNNDSFVVKTQYIVAVSCNDEPEMKKLFEELKDRGFECKLIT